MNEACQLTDLIVAEQQWKNIKQEKIPTQGHTEASKASQSSDDFFVVRL